MKQLGMQLATCMKVLFMTKTKKKILIISGIVVGILSLIAATAMFGFELLKFLIQFIFVPYTL